MIDSNDKHLQKSKHDHTHIYISIMFIIMEQLYRMWGEAKEKRAVESQQYENTFHLCR
jgi:hypothetical protein